MRRDLFPYCVSLAFSDVHITIRLSHEDLLTCLGTAIPVVPSAISDQKVPPPPPTPVKFPGCTPQTEKRDPSTRSGASLITSLQTIQRPTDIKLAHFEALGLHVLPEASPEHIIPDPSYLPPVDEWRSLSQQGVEEANTASKRPLNNGGQSPGVQTYLERENELSIDNTAAFRSVRRIPPLPGQNAARLGNAYEFFKNLEFFSGYWLDTSLPPEADNEDPADKDEIPVHLRTHVRVSTGSQLPLEYRQNLVIAFLKLVAYDFGCNVSLPRCEPRLQVTPPSSPVGMPSKPPSHFASNMHFVYRTPRDRASARSGIVEGPLAGVSCRPTTGFSTDVDSHFDLAREVISVLLTAQHRARQGKEETRFGVGKWWTEKKRWGGGKGGSIGKEGEKFDAPFNTGDMGVLPGPSPSKKPKKGNTMQIYDNYRKMLPPSSTWDRKARYCAIGKDSRLDEFDDIFLVSSLNHHVSIVRTRVPTKLLDTLDGKATEGGWERMVMWRSKWYDLYLKDERIQAMRLVWGMMAWLMRKIDDPPSAEGKAPVDGNAGPGGKMEIDS